MISVRSHRPQLNGSKYVSLVFVLSFLLSSCGIFFPQSPTNAPVQTQNQDTKPNKVDTVRWEKIPESEKPPITSGDEVLTIEIESPKKDLYQISLFLPLATQNYRFADAERFLEKSDERFLHFYAGLRLAVKEINKYGQKIELYTQDTKSSTSVTNSLVRERVNRTSDLWIGPYDRDCLAIAARNAKQQKIPIVSPWQASSKITSDNPYYIQIRPDLKDHYYRILEHVYSSFPSDNVVIISSEKPSDKNRLEYLQSMAEALEDRSGESLLEYHVLRDSVEYGEFVFDSLFMKYQDPVIILPNWSFGDENYIYNCLRKLNIEKGENKVYVYGMPILLESEKIDYDFYTQLNLRSCRSKFLNPTTLMASRFKIDFYREYGALPREEAYEGYDLIQYLAGALIDHGTRFQYFLDETSPAFMQSTYRVEKDFPEGDDSFKKINYFKNRHLDIIQFEGDQFRVLSNGE